MLEGVQSIHELKVWAITSRKVVLTVHLVAPDVDQKKLYDQAFHILHERHHISDMTLQIEDNNWHKHQHAK